MRVTIDSTPAVEPVGELLLARRWAGATDSGIPVVALILNISPQTHDPAVAAQFAAELREISPPGKACPGRKQGPPSIAPKAGEVDRARVEPLTVEILRLIRPELTREPHGRENVFVVLNALPGAAAPLIAGTRDDRARQFFGQALADNIATLRCPDNSEA